MKIIQLATLVSPDGAYGGPVRVAINQTRALLDAGHDVVFAAGAQGFGRRLPKTYDGVPVRLFDSWNLTRSGFSGLVAPDLQTWLKTAVKSADVAHLHLARDLIMLPAADRVRRRNLPYVLQTHGMIAPSSHPLRGPIDALWTKRALLEAKKVFYLTPQERNGLLDVASAPLNLQKLYNGVPAPHADLMLETQPKIEVLFLARMHRVKRPEAFVAMARVLHGKYPNVRFSLVGPDEGEGQAITAAIRAAGMGALLGWEGPIAPEETALRIRKAAIYVLPSIEDVFPMSVLEAMSLGKPVVITNTCGLARAVTRARAGAVVGPTVESLTAGVDSLLANVDLRNTAGKRAQQLAQDEFSIEAVCKSLQQVYREVASEGIRSKNYG